MKKTTAFFGGSFDPPHLGHLGVARGALRSGACRRVVWVPSWSQPQKQGVKAAPFAHRLAMTELLIRGEGGMAVSDIEARLRLQPSYTVDVLKYFAGELPADEEPALLIGADSLLALHTWHRAAELVAAYRILTYPRPGCGITKEILARSWPEETAEKLLGGVMEGAFFEISSTGVRNSMAKREKWSYVMEAGGCPLSGAVREYCEKHALYED